MPYRGWYVRTVPVSVALPLAPTSVRRENLPLRAVLGYGAGNFAFSLLGLVVAVNLQFFYTDYVGLSAGLVSWALLFARLFDAFVDLVIGWLSDRTNTRLGRRRPFIVGAAIPLGIAFYLLFAPPELANPARQQGRLLVYMLGFYTLTFLIWTIGAIPYYSLGAELTDDYLERTRVIAVREGWGLAGLLAATILPAYLIDLYGGRHGYAAMGAILGAATAAFLFFSGLVARERPEFQGRPALNPYAGIAATFENRPFRALLAAFASSAIAGACLRRSWLGPGTVGFFSAILVVGGMSFGNYLALPPSIVADLIDSDEASTGLRHEGAYFAIWSLATKAGNAITGFAALQVLEHVGYVPGVPQTELVKTWMLWMYSWFPAFWYLISALALLGFRFTRDDLDQAQRQIGRA